MLAISKAECLKRGMKWTAAREAKYNKWLIEEKKKIFEELQIPFPAEIETKFKAALAKGIQNVEIYLDNLCHDHIIYAYEHYNEILYDALRSKYHDDILHETDIKKVIGKYGLEELKKANLLESSDENKMYKVRRQTYGGNNI